MMYHPGASFIRFAHWAQITEERVESRGEVIFCPGTNHPTPRAFALPLIIASPSQAVAAYCTRARHAFRVFDLSGTHRKTITRFAATQMIYLVLRSSVRDPASLLQ